MSPSRHVAPSVHRALTLLTITALLGLVPGPGVQAYGPDRMATEAVVAKSLQANPGIVADTRAAHQRERQAAQAEARRAAAASLRDAFRNGSTSIGSESADAVHVVEFVDYNCGYCKRSLITVTDVLERDPDVRFTFVEFPILGSSSRTAARAALAATEQGRYFDLHAALLQHRGALNDDTVLAIAGGLGLDLERLQADMASEQVSARLAANQALAEALQVGGTPAFFVNDIPNRGWLDTEKLEGLIEQARNGAR